jgi:hypothetical protein
MKIDRSDLVSELEAFALKGSGVVIGAPGIGKSYTLAELRESLKKSGVIHLILPVERLGTGSGDNLKAILKRDGDFVALLKEAVANTKAPAILIFDGFDAARGENERAGIFNLIRRAVTELCGQWNTIVSVRTFDAKKSQQLLELFPSENDPTASCRQFFIPPLRPKELEQAFSQMPDLKEIYAHGTQEFRTLLTVPFNLWLIERVLQAGAKSSEFSQVISEVQLLEMYWNYRIRKANRSEDREYLLAQATRAMVENHTLTIRRENVYRPEARDAWEQLLSAEIFTELIEQNVRIAFTHNILFDYSVSVYLLESDPAKLAEFVAKEPARPLFLRPSLVYHFTRLWHFNRAVFWQMFWDVVGRREIHLRQIIRLVLPAVIVNEAQTTDDLNPLLEQLTKKESIAFEAVAFLLQAVRFLQPSKQELWANFLQIIGQHLDYRFAWDAGIIATGIIDAKSGVSEKSIIACGDFGRSLLRWAWDSRKDEEKKQWLERLAALVAIPLVAKTYATNIQEGRPLFEKILQVVGEPHFPIDCIYRLTNEVAHLIPHDSNLVGLIYEKVFGYEETSQDQTHMGGHVIPMISNRRQDYGMCHFCLIQVFPKFLATQTPSALRSGLKAIQAFVIQDHLLRYLRDGKKFEDLILQFEFRGGIASYVEDGSAIWDETSYPDRELQIADEIFNWFSEAVKNNRTTDIKTFLETFKTNVSLAFLWSRLLVVAATHPATLGQCLWELAKAEPFFEQNDTLHAVGLFLERAAEFFSKEQRQEIEQAILDLPRDAEGQKKEFREKRRNRLIARIPAAFLVSPDAITLRSVLEKESGLPPNEPLFKITSSFKDYSEEDYFREQGAKLDSPANQKIRELYKPLKEWGEKGKEESQIDVLLPNAVVLKDVLAKESGADETVINTAWTHLAAFASDAIVKTKSSDTNTFSELRKIVLDAAKHPLPVFNSNYDSNWNHASWSPAPRNDAAQALPWMAHFGEDKEILTAIQKLASDPVPSVRFLLACELWRIVEHNSGLMWSTLDEFAEKETNGTVLQGVTVSLWQLIRWDKARSLKLIEKLLNRAVEESDDEAKARGSLVSMVVDYAVTENNQWARETIACWRNNALELAATLAVAGRRLIAYIAPNVIEIQLERARELLIMHLDTAAKALTDLRKRKDIPKEEFQIKWKQLYGIIDEAVMRIYFAADIDSNLRQQKNIQLNDEARKQFFIRALPVLEKILEFGKQPEIGMLLAPTAHHFMELLNGVLRYDPPLVLRMAAEVVSCSKRFNYNLDSMAMGEIVKLVESILADYRDKVQDEASIKNLLELLDAFVEVGWPEALSLVWRLDEIYR